MRLCLREKSENIIFDRNKIGFNKAGLILKLKLDAPNVEALKEAV